MKEIKIRYFYKGEEISIEAFRELEKKSPYHLPYRQEASASELKIYIQDVVVPSILMDEVGHYPSQWSNFWKHYPSTVGEVVHSNPFNTGDYCPKKERVKDMDKQNGNTSIKEYTQTIFPVSDEHLAELRSKDEGVKYNSGKPRLSILFKQFPDALKAVTKCAEYGHEKYKKFDADFLNFKRVKGGSQNYADATLRHRTEVGNDLESGLPHQYHVAWNALAELQLWIEEEQNKTEK